MEPVKRRGKLLSMAEVLGKTLGRDGEMEEMERWKMEWDHEEQVGLTGTL